MRRTSSKALIVLKKIGATLLGLIAVGVNFSLAYLLTDYLFHRMGIEWPDYAVQLTNYMLGIQITLLVIWTIGIIMRPKQMAVWHEIIDALKRIAKGDFNVSLNRRSGFNGQFGEFVQNINHMAHELKQIEQLRQEFISNVSHEFQSPLTSIRGFANALQNEGLSPEERRHYASIIEAESARLSKLSDNLMKLTSLESEHQPFEPREYRLDVQIRRIVLASEPQWLDKGLEMELDLPETKVTADEELMSQVWINLIHNSIKFTPAGGKITIAVERAKDRVAVRVADTGIGMPPEAQERIFERFYMEDKARSRTNGGSGLGLSIVKRIVELHHGDIQVTSAPGAGSEFHIDIPC